MASKHIYKRNIIICSFLFLLCLPFLLMRSVYPFYRFGMFAELGAKSSVSAVQFIVVYTAEMKETRFYPTMAGLNAGTFRYLKRNYYYRQEADKLLKVLQERFQDGEQFGWRFYRVDGIDTTASRVLIAEIQPKPSNAYE